MHAQGEEEAYIACAVCMQEPLQLRNTNTLAPKDGLRVRVLPRALEREA